ncbi:hypothetical protein DdX_14055 [Ditylenchus destructor]|uniref:Protein kinase domain-containing protein n=1 Tax=Ditylenchus destructor TaxID=166010 RepID=A0AAD4R288_9BILA|nr:hypothetical protein DdX_14055 [Ditylenchus destructor]
MISSTFTSVTFVIRLLLFTSCLFNNFVFTTKPLSDGLQDLRNDWKDTLIQNKSIDFSDRKEASFSGPLRTDEKFQQIKLSPPLRDFGYPALVSDGTELHAKIILIRANLNVKDEETVVNFIRSFVKGTHGHKITDMTAFDWNDDNVCVFFEFWSWYVEHQLTALRNGWRKAEYKQVRYEHFDDHSKTKLIGKGNYGKVYLVKRRKDNKDFAMKDMLVDNVFTETKRDLSYRKRRIDYMFSEVDVLTDIKTEFTTDMVGFDIEVDPVGFSFYKNAIL